MWSQGGSAPPLPHLAWFSILNTALQRPGSTGGPRHPADRLPRCTTGGHTQITLLYISCLFIKKTRQNFSERVLLASALCLDLVLTDRLHVRLKPHTHSLSPGRGGGLVLKFVLRETERNQLCLRNISWEDIKTQPHFTTDCDTDLQSPWQPSVTVGTERGEDTQDGLKQNLLIFTEQAPKSQIHLHVFSSVCLLLFLALLPSLPSPPLPPLCLFFIYTSPRLSAVAQGAVTEVSLVIIGLIQ